MKPFGQDENVKIDQAHAELLKGLVVASKPTTVLEIGLGGGQSADAMLSALDYNQQKFSYTIVDNWFDWNGTRPDGVIEKYGSRCTIIDSAERDFVFSTTGTWDFIMSDGDHMHAEQWFEFVYENLLNPGGILVYHDINLIDKKDIFENLIDIYNKTKQYNLSHKLFNKNSLASERCQRGLLVIFKP